MTTMTRTPQLSSNGWKAFNYTMILRRGANPARVLDAAAIEGASTTLRRSLRRAGEMSVGEGCALGRDIHRRRSNMPARRTFNSGRTLLSGMNALPHARQNSLELAHHL